MENTTVKTASPLKGTLTVSPALPYIVPFAIYMAFVAVLEIVPLAGLELPEHTAERLYPVKIGLVAISLFVFRKHYKDVYFIDLRNWKDSALSIATGLLVFIAWINIDFSFAIQGEQTSFDPTIFDEAITRQTNLALRVLGAILIVPIMEELFWRSFLARYLLKKDFLKSPIGQFTPFSFFATAILFGLEHQMFLAGVAAGVAYNLLLLRTKSISHCILSHGITNLALAIYVLTTGRWYLW